MSELGKIKLPVGQELGGTPKPNDPPTFTETTIGTEKYNLNTNGEAVDTTGKVIKTKEEIETLKKGVVIPGQETPEQIAAKATAAALAEKTKTVTAQLIEGAEVELDDVKYKLNKDGNAVDATGKVVKTKAELTTLLLAVEENNEVDYISEIQKVTNLALSDDSGNPITYENSVQGLAQREQDVFKEGRKLGATEYETQLISKFPVLKSVIEHLTINGSLDGFNEDVDYSKITLTDDEAQHIDLYTRAQLKRGVPQAEITEMISYYKADKKLKGAAQSALTFLTTDQTNASTKRAADAATARSNADAEKTKYWNEVNKVLTSKQIIIGDKKFSIPEIIKVKEADGKVVTKTSNDFQEYIQKPLTFTIDEKKYVMTQLEYDEAVEDINRTPHHDLFDAYRKFTKYDDSQLIAANVSSNAVKQIIKLKTKANGGSGTTGKGGKLILPIK